MHIPAQNMEIEQIYSQIMSGGNRAIAICSANAGEGVTSIALALAQRNLLAGNSTLLVDLNLFRPALNGLLGLEATSTETEIFDPLQIVSTNYHSVALTGITAPSKREMIMKLRRPGVLEQCIAEWHKTFDTVIFDTSPISRMNANNIPPEQVAAACDGSLLVVLAGHTTEAMVATAVEKINTAGARLLGCIYNDRDNPPLKNELLREIQRLEPRFNRITHRLKMWVKQNRLLTLEI